MEAEDLCCCCLWTYWRKIQDFYDEIRPKRVCVEESEDKLSVLRSIEYDLYRTLQDLGEVMQKVMWVDAVPFGELYS